MTQEQGGRTVTGGAVGDALARAKALHNAGRFAEAGSAYEGLLAARPNDPNLSYLAGLAALQHGDAAKAAEHLGRTVKLRPAFSEAHNNLANALAKLNRDEAAMAHYARAAEINPEYTVAIKNRAFLCAKLRRHDEALAGFERALELDAEFSDGHNGRGVTLQSLGRPEEAVAAFRRALEIKSDHLSATMNLGHGLQLIGRLDEAEAAYRRAVEIDANNANAVFSVGAVLEEKGRIEDAIACYRKALAIDPACGGAANNLRIALDFRPDFEPEIAACRQTLAERPDDAGLKVKLAGLLWRHGDVAEAGAILEPVLAANTGNMAAHYYLGLVRRSGDDAEGARRHFAHAQALAPGNVHVEAAMASTDAARPARTVAGSKRVALHINKPFHYRILKPVFDALADRHACLFTPHVMELAPFRPDVVVVTESTAPFLRGSMPDAVFVSTRHGLISKNTTALAARVNDYFCLTSEASREWYLRHGGPPRREFWITGYSQMDPLFRPGALPIDVELEAGARLVLYAPTWTPGLSSADMLGERAVDLICGARDDITVVIKPHPVTIAHRPEWLDTWRALARSDPRVHLRADPAADIMPYLKRADILVTDTSSVIFQYLAVDRPIVLITNPAHKDCAHYDPDGIEWRWRDVGREVHRVEDLARAVSDALDDPAIGAARRAKYRSELFGELTDGRAGERIADNITRLRL